MNIAPLNIVNVNHSVKVYSGAGDNNSCIRYNTYLLKTPVVDRVSFTGAPNSAVLKRLLAYDIPDMYSDIILLDPQVLERFMRTRLFSKSIRSIYKAMQPYEKCLFPVEKQVFKIIKRTARYTPNARLDELIHKLIPQHNKKLLEIQKPIFDRLTELSKGMPDDLRLEYDKLLSITNLKLSNEPVLVPFSLKEFKYKLGRIKERIDKTNNSKEKYEIKKIVNMVEKVPLYSKANRTRKDFPHHKYDRRLKAMLWDISDYIAKSSLYKNKELKDLIESSKSRLYKVPVNIRFNRKSFIYDLQTITDKLQDRKLANMMVQTAVKLPTSKENLSAFIMKSAERSSEQIGFDLISGSVGTAEHLVPSKNNGQDSILNYGLASAYMNSERAHRDFKLQLKRYPEIRIYIQRQVDRLIELANSGVFSKIGLSKLYIKTYVNKLYKLSSKETPLIIDTSRLK